MWKDALYIRIQLIVKTNKQTKTQVLVQFLEDVNENNCVWGLLVVREDKTRMKNKWKSSNKSTKKG